MPRIAKPVAPSVKTADMNASLDKVKAAINEVKTTRGTVNVKKLEQKLANDPMAQQAFDAIKDQFSHTETRTSSGCGGGTVRVEVDPKSLKASEVEDVMTALINAKKKVKNLDRNDDGKLSAGEADRASNLRGLSGTILQRAIEGTRDDYEFALQGWCEKLEETADTVGGRQEIEDEITSMASWHAKTKRGAKALAWAFRNLATSGHDDAVWRMDNILRRAETGGESPLMAMVFRNRSSTAEGHLLDSEIKTLLAATDLDKFSRRAAAEIKDRVGGAYTTFYVKGKDLPGGTQLEDPDFVEYMDGYSRTGC